MAARGQQRRAGPCYNLGHGEAADAHARPGGQVTDGNEPKVLDYAPKAPRARANAERWARIKARGYWRFVLLRGVVGFGGVMFVVTAGSLWLFVTMARPFRPLRLAIFWEVGGFCWAVATWWLSERMYGERNG
jgi:hypothetical protein